MPYLNSMSADHTLFSYLSAPFFYSFNTRSLPPTTPRRNVSHQLGASMSWAHQNGESQTRDGSGIDESQWDSWGVTRRLRDGNQ